MKDGIYQILHVEDNKYQLRNCQLAINGVLNPLGKTAEFISAYNIQEAESKIMRHNRELDLIILDIDLGLEETKSGLMLIDEIHHHNPSIPIFVLSTNVDKFESALKEMKSRQRIRGYSEPVNKPWADDIRRILESKLVNILHLSDIHEGKFFAYNNLVVNKTTLLKELCKRVENVDFVVISGDLSSTNSDEDYRNARELLNLLKGDLGLSSNQFVFTPGNHDRDRDCMDTRLFFRYIHFVNQFYSSDFSYNSILEYPSEMLSDDYTSQQSVFDNLISISAFPAQRTIIVSMNSVNPRDKSEYLTRTCFAEENAKCGLLSGGEISSEQIQNVKNKLNQMFRKYPETESYARIATFHHNVFEPSHIEQFTWCPTILNEGNLMRFLTDYGFRFILHGHLHYAENYVFCVGNDNSGISVISTGTLSGKDRNMSKCFCANKISYFVDKQGCISKATLTEYTIPNDAAEWKIEESPIHFIDGN